MLGSGQDYHFIFIVDRSGSMKFEPGNRMAKARDVLDLFLRSLPSGCHFSIISFGCDCKSMKIKDAN